jgi:hypothetical protein
MGAEATAKDIFVVIRREKQTRRAIVIVGRGEQMCNIVSVGMADGDDGETSVDEGNDRKLECEDQRRRLETAIGSGNEKVIMKMKDRGRLILNIRWAIKTCVSFRQLSESMMVGHCGLLFQPEEEETPISR